ncbi:DUF4270 family protein [Polaribacter sp. IC073]|uniref:DUF4270 family protein n=1 Tax=Polaribacter sp. IC073 TaxID=2508540 RepID=UPI0016733360|nr:DUF4270 family protein [Polaribacter sp. IC073]
MKNIFRKSTYFGVLFLVFAGVISCEKDFTDIGSGVVSNTKFSTNDTILEVLVSNAGIESIRADGLGLTGAPYFGFQGQYLLGAYISDEYENIEASIISQININTTLELVSYENPDELTFETSIDTAFLRLPYHATLTSNTNRPIYELDSVIGNQQLPFTLNIYELETYLNTLNPSDPTKTNRFQSDHEYAMKSNPLTVSENMDFLPTANDTLVYIKRRNSNGDLHKIDTIRYTSNTSSDLPLPMAIIPLKKSFVKEVFLDNYGTANFDSQNNFNNYFRGIVIEAKEKTHASGEKGGALVAFNLRSSSIVALNPLIEVYYTNTFFKKNSTEIDTVITNTHTFQLGGITNSKYTSNNKTYAVNNEVKLQGAAGSEAKVEILTGTQLTDLKNENWLINDAALTFYINQDSDTTNTANQLYLYKRGEALNSAPILSHIKDVLSEGFLTFGGSLQKENSKKDHYTFKITDYLSDILGGNTSYNPPLRLKVYNTSDTQITDTIFRNYNWNPKAVSILNGDKSLNGARRAQLKISYTKKNN